jgi:ketosteroid isomerase-like protein
MDLQQFDRASTGTAVAVEAPSKEEVVARLFEAFSRRDMDDALELLDPAIVFQPVTAELTRQGEPYRGHDGMRRYMSDVEAVWEELTVHPTRIRAAGDAVVAMGVAAGRARGGGSFEDVPATWMFKFRDDLVVQIQIFSDPGYAREALAAEVVTSGV